MATEHYLVITDGVDTVTIADGSGGATDYKLQYASWAPAVAASRTSQVAGRGPYEDVVESMDLLVSGATVPAILASIAKLARLLDNAARWRRGENTAAVLIKFSPKGGTVSTAANPLQAVILGRAAGDQTLGLHLPANIGDLTGTNLIVVDIHVSFLRRGQWLANTEVSAASAATANSHIATITLAATDFPSPTRLSLTNFGYGKTPTTRFHGGFILLGEEVNAGVPIDIADAEEGAGDAGGHYTSVVDSGANARNTNVLRYTPTTTAEDSSAQINAALPATIKLAGVFVNVRPSTTVDFRLRVGKNTAGFVQYTDYVDIPANATQYPKWYFCGYVSITDESGWFIYVTAATASSFLDIDSLVIFDARSVHVLGLPGPSDDAGYTLVVSFDPLTHDHNLLSETAAEVSWDPVSNEPINIPYAGDPVFMTKVGTLYATLLATGGGTAAAGNKWRQSNTGTNAVLNNTWTAYRRAGYLVPQ